MTSVESSSGALKQSKAAYFARLGSRPIPRVVRMMNEARNLGYDCVFIGARREKGLPEKEQYAGHNVRRIGPFFPLLNGSAGWLYLRSVLGFNLAFWKVLREVRPNFVHCSDIETMPAGVLYRWVSGARLIYNIHDNLAQRYDIPNWAQTILNQIEGIAVRLSSLALVPEEFRREMLPTWSQRKVSIVRNTPEDRGVAKPSDDFPPIRLFFGGWLDEGRGLRQLLKMVRDNEEFELTLAGEGSPELVAEILSTPRTRYLGFVTHDEIMEQTVQAHVVTALYDPARPINRFAASNKLSEALSCGRPVLVNCEMAITQSLSQYGCLVTVPYEEIDSQAAENLRSLMTNEGKLYRTMCAAARTAFEKRYAWKSAQTAMIDAING